MFFSFGVKYHLDMRIPFYGNFPITYPFGSKPFSAKIRQKYKEWGILGHNGIDFGLPMNTPVLATDSGIVVSAGINGDFGIAVVLQHPWGRSLYAHLNKTVVVVKQVIKVGEIIGFSGKTGTATGPHLHFGIKPNNPDRKNGYSGFIDPMQYFLK